MLNFDQPYCLLHRDGRFRYVTGDIQRVKLLADVPRPAPGPDAWPVISMVPYAQLRERGFRVHDDGETVLTLVPRGYREVSEADIVPAGAEPEIRTVGEPRYRVGDEQYADMVARVIREEIQRGEGSNFLISRKCEITLADFSAAAANLIFRRLARNETGAYLTFCFFDGERYFVGSSPERHITVERDVVTMNPICGTLPKAALHRRADLIEFLADPKEINELFQVVDEEMKMMARICDGGGVITGPFLKEMGSLIHTEYRLEGSTGLDKMTAFRESMFAATMIGSPLENAARVIHQYEPESRRYYSSAILVLDRDADGEERLDSAITIRTMEVDAAGEAVIQSGASIVRDSEPAKETREVRAKVEGMLRAIAGGEATAPVLPDYVDAMVSHVLRSRNEYLSRFWLERQSGDRAAPTGGPSVLLVDNEDEFTYMLKHLLERLGCTARVRTWDDPDLDADVPAADLVLVGPGPGDPADLSDPKMRRIDALLGRLLAEDRPFLAICLGHQVLCRRLGMETVASDPPLQGVQQSVDLFGRREPVGFYCTFFAETPAAAPTGVEIAAEPDGKVIALRSADFYSVQFHVESVLTTNCTPILQEALSWLRR